MRYFKLGAKGCYKANQIKGSDMNNLIPGIIMSFREGLEAFLILVLILKFIERTDNKHLNRIVIYGFISGVTFSLIIGFLLFFIGGQLKKMDEVGKLWESIASLIAVGLVTSFILWMIQHGSKIKKYVEYKTAINLTKFGIYIVSFILIAREGVEIAIFSFAGQYHYLSIIIGIFISLLISLSVYFSLVKVEIASIFKITLIYLIIQAGYLLGYGLHEGLSALKSLGFIKSNSILLIKVFDFSKTTLEHKEGLIGLPLNILFGWYSKPEWIQFITQYIFTILLLIYWIKRNKSSARK